MKETVLHLFQQYPNAALAISLLISVVVAILGLVPSFFVTAANILFFGFWEGTLISFAGEAIGAAVAFWLYRKGFKKNASQQFDRFPKVKQLINAENKQAFLLVLSLRLFPFVPSGLITFAAAIGRISFFYFLVSSSLGKMPAMLIEAYSVYKITSFDWQGKLILFCIAAVLLYISIKNIRSRQKSRHNNNCL